MQGQAELTCKQPGVLITAARTGPVTSLGMMCWEFWAPAAAESSFGLVKSVFAFVVVSLVTASSLLPSVVGPRIPLPSFGSVCTQDAPAGADLDGHSLMTHKKLMNSAQSVTAVLNLGSTCITLLLNSTAPPSEQGEGLCTQNIHKCRAHLCSCSWELPTSESINPQIGKYGNAPGVLLLGCSVGQSGDDHKMQCLVF